MFGLFWNIWNSSVRAIAVCILPGFFQRILRVGYERMKDVDSSVEPRELIRLCSR